MNIIWFPILILLPGIVIFGLFRQKDTPILDWLLYVIGISFLFDIAVGLALNFILPVFGMSQPLSFVPITITWVCVLIIGTVVTLRFHLIPKIRPDKSWLPPLLIYLVSVFFIYLMTLPTTNLLGSDVHLEYYHASQTLIKGYWDYSLFDPINICLPITILLPMFSIVMDADMFTIFKVFQPLLMGLFPLVLYRIYKIQFGQSIAILTTVFFITLPLFNMDLVQLIRQQYSMYFFALVVLLFVGNSIGIYTKVLFGMAFSTGVIASHYGLGVGFSGYMFFTVVFIALFRVKYLQSAWRWIIRMKEGLSSNLTSNLRYQLITLIFLSATCAGFIWLYYSNTASGAGMSAVDVASQLASRTISDIQNTDNINFGSIKIVLSEPLLYTAVGLDFTKASVLGKVWRFLLYLIELCFIIGFIRLLIRPNSIGKIRAMFFAFIVASITIISGMYLLRTAAYGMGASRIFGIALVFVAPLFIYGVDTVVRLFPKWKQSYTVIATSCLLVPFFAFNSGIVFEVTRSSNLPTVDIPYSIALSSHRLDITSRFEPEDIEAAKWVSENMIDGYKVYGDVHGSQLMYQIYGYYDNKVKYLHEVNRESTGFLFLRKHNVDTKTLTWGSSYGCRKSIPWEGSEFVYMVRDNTVVFDNGAMVILLKRVDFLQ